MKVDEIVHSDPEILRGEPVFVGTVCPKRLNRLLAELGEPPLTE